MASWDVTVRALALAGGVALCAGSFPINLPGDDSGYAPEQPIAFSHRVHAGTLEMQCQYCHTGVSKSRVAGVPAAGICMNCHTQVTAASDAVDVAVSPELARLYAATGFDPHAKAYDPDLPTSPIEWIKVHDLPDFVSFDHSRHVNAEIDCSHCHGDVASMDRVVQVGSLTMGFCVNCHRDVSGDVSFRGHLLEPSTDCGVCHH